MSLRYKWPEAQIRAALAPALDYGEALIHFDTMTDAERFRYAFYTLRRRKGFGHGYSVIINPTPTSDGEIEILITRTPVLELKRIQTYFASRNQKVS